MQLKQILVKDVAILRKKGQPLDEKPGWILKKFIDQPNVIYQPHEAVGELLKRNFCIAPAEVASLRFNLGSDRKLRKRQNSTSKQM